jgi:GNAT superfamily N-acetyltransferase
MPTARVGVKLATPELSEPVAKVIGAAFRDLEASAWLVPDAQWRNDHYWRFFQHAYLTPALIPSRGTVYVTADHLGAAVWLHHEPYHDDTPTPEFMAELKQITGRWSDNFVAFGELLDKAHQPFTAQSHDYLGVIGVHPVLWRQGSARALMDTHLAVLDDYRRPAYLEAANANLVELWKKFGFAQTEDIIRLPGGHAMFPMWREPSRP